VNNEMQEWSSKKIVDKTTGLLKKILFLYVKIKNINILKAIFKLKKE